MKNVKSSEISNLKANHEVYNLVKYGRQLHSEAVYKGVMSIFKLFRHSPPTTVQINEKRENLNYSH